MEMSLRSRKLLGEREISAAMCRNILNENLLQSSFTSGRGYSSCSTNYITRMSLKCPAKINEDTWVELVASYS